MANKQNIRDLRESRGMTVGELSVLTGLTTNRINKLEHNSGGISFCEVVELAKALEVRYGELIDD